MIYSNIAVCICCGSFSVGISKCADCTVCINLLCYSAFVIVGVCNNHIALSIRPWCHLMLAVIRIFNLIAVCILVGNKVVIIVIGIREYLAVRKGDCFDISVICIWERIYCAGRRCDWLEVVFIIVAEWCNKAFCIRDFGEHTHCVEASYFTISRFNLIFIYIVLFKLFAAEIALFFTDFNRCKGEIVSVRTCISALAVRLKVYGTAIAAWIYEGSALELWNELIIFKMPAATEWTVVACCFRVIGSVYIKCTAVIGNRHIGGIEIEVTCIKVYRLKTKFTVLCTTD